MFENEQPDRLDLIEKDIDPSHTYAPEEVSTITGYSIELVHRLIESNTFYARDYAGRVRVTGSSVLQYVRYHRDALEMYSRYSERRQRQAASRSKAKSGVGPQRTQSALRLTGEPVATGKRTFRRKSA